MSEYRENDDNMADDYCPQEEVTTEEEVSSEEQDFTPSNPDLSENGIDDEIVTAVLLIKNKQGAVLPVTKLDSLKMERQANAHEVLRMCADVQDQIGAIRIVGELAQIFQHLNSESLKGIAQLLNVKMNQSVAPTSEE